MTAYLITHPPARSQFRRPRRERPSGVAVVHTAENTPDWIPPDGGAENVASFIAGRRDAPGSYHDLADSDSDVHLVPYDAEAYGDATGSNPHAYHVSAATTAARWAQAPAWWREATVKRMAACAARYGRWCKANGYTPPAARRITREQSELRLAGFLAHADRDPARRSDPGRDFPWDLFLSEYALLMEPARTRLPKRVTRYLAEQKANRQAVKREIERLKAARDVARSKDEDLTSYRDALKHARKTRRQLRLTRRASKKVPRR